MTIGDGAEPILCKVGEDKRDESGAVALVENRDLPMVRGWQLELNSSELIAL